MPNTRLGNYELILQLATGGMAAVFVARLLGAAGFERLVVIKRVHRHLLSNHDFYGMFRDEARLASIVRHPNVVPVIDVVESDGELLLVQEYIESTALSTLFKAAVDAGQPIPPAVGVRMVADTLAGLHAAHEALDMRGNHLEIVHRDVSPQNIIVGVDGASRLIDFGVAKARHRITETKSGSLKGKYGYMSPEQAKAMPLDRRADLFAVGIVLHEVLTGRRLFQGENELDTLRRIMEGKVPDPSSMAAGVPPALDAVVQKALARDREARFQSAAEFLDALEHALRPASAREVATVLQRLCGERLAQRREAMRAKLEGAAVPEHRVDRATLPSVPSAMRARASEFTVGQLTSTHDAPVSMRPGRSAKWIAMALAALAVIALVVTTAAIRGAKETTAAPEPRSAAQAPATASAMASAATEAKDDSVTLTLHADGPIESVRAAGTRRVRIDGATATLAVAPWSGKLAIDALLTSGKQEHTEAAESGARDLTLKPPAPSPPQVKPSARVRPAAPATAAPPDLQPSPYGPQ